MWQKMTDFEYLELVYKNNYEQLPCISSHISFFLYLHTPTSTPNLQLCHLPRHDPPWLTSKLRASPRQKKQMDEKTIILTFPAIEPNPKIFEKNKKLRVVGDDDKLALFTSGLRRKIPPPAS